MTQTEIERTKYHRMWTEVPRYRSHSPGEVLTSHFVRHATGLIQGDSIIDLGCGPGRASALLSEGGFNVTQLDITEASLDPAVRQKNIPFVEACLWELPEDLPVFDWLYCCDVLEHIPTDKVDAVLDGMAAITGKGAFLQIALFAEVFGRYIAATLHLTVKPAGWWQEKILQRWHCEKFDIAGNRLVALTGKPK